MLLDYTFMRRDDGGNVDVEDIVHNDEDDDGTMPHAKGVQYLDYTVSATRKALMRLYKLEESITSRTIKINANCQKY